MKVEVRVRLEKGRDKVCIFGIFGKKKKDIFRGIKYLKRNIEI